MNNFIFSGNLGKDAEQKFLSNGTAVLSFSVAVKSGFGDKEKTTWVSCGLFGKRAEGALAQYLVKGAQVLISGEAFLDEWEKDGVTNKMLKVNVDKLDLIGGRSDSAPQQASRPQQSAPQPQAPRQAPQRPAPQQLAPQQGSAPAIDEWQDDIPF
jgi:single-strand DNA-binding protein